MMMSAPSRISPNCTMPSPLTSLTEISEASTFAHCRIQDGRLSKLLPTRPCITSYFTSTASAGTLRYSRAMKNRAQPTEERASATVGVV